MGGTPTFDVLRSPHPVPPRKGEGTLRPAHRDDGFTLVEVLVSLVLLALVLAVLSGGLRFARGTWDAAGKLDEHAGYAMAERFLRARLGEAMPLYEHSAAGTVRVAFHGTAETLSFVAPAPNGPAGAALYRYALEAQPRPCSRRQARSSTSRS